MSKLDILNEGREQGLLHAHKIMTLAKERGEDPVEALEAELKFRKRVRLDTLLTKKELEEANKRYLANAIESCGALAMVTLWDEFHFGKVRNARFIDAYTRNTDAFFEGYLTWEDVLETLDKKCDIKIDLSDDLAMRR